MKQENILITGGNGQLGKALRSIYPEAKFTDSETLDITNVDSLSHYPWADVSVIINAAAYTKVDEAETTSGRKSAWKTNAVAVANLANIANKHDLTLVHISSDYVFDGKLYEHKEDEPFSPLSVYGQTKAAGDIAASVAKNHYIIRTSWVIGDGNNFVRTMLALGNKGINPKVVADQIGRPTFTKTIAEAIDFLLKTKPARGTYNLSNEGRTVSWADFARSVYSFANKNNIVTDISTNDFFAEKDYYAPRPEHSSFDLSKLKSLGFEISNWENELSDYIEREETQ